MTIKIDRRQFWAAADAGIASLMLGRNSGGQSVVTAYLAYPRFFM